MTESGGRRALARTTWSLRGISMLVGAALLLAVAPAMPAQSRGPVNVLAREVVASVDRSTVVPLPILASHVALHWRGAPEAHISVAFSKDGQAFGAAHPVEHDEAGSHAPGADTYGGVIWTGGAGFVRVTSDRPIARVTVVAMDARDTGASATSDSYVAAAVDQPSVISRGGWGADESLRYDDAGNVLWPSEFYPVQKLIVHHTAGKNGDPDPAATVRAIYHYHAVTRGWGDIGYNFLVDESGRVYEGRYSRPYAAGESPTGEDVNGNGVTAAHVAGYNSGTVGIALLGTLSTQDATASARDGLEAMLAWKADRHDIDPLATSLYTNPVNGTQKTFPNISAHRDHAATECPGEVFYDTLPALRSAVAARVGGTAPPATVPGAPVLSAQTATSGTGVQLTWSAPTDGGSVITSYRVFRKDGRRFGQIATVSGSTTTYRDSATKKRRTYTYVVRAVNAIGVGPESNQASAVAR